ncbi:MAG TPA: glycosyltransferase family 4 protein [Bryobacteraceae bacterium]|nr:glycosyltransferase family 4 protein [Bryobacteraceae bacterium]
MRFAFLTGTPLSVERGSGTYAGITTLARGVEACGHKVEIIAPRAHLPVYTAERLLFNEQLRRMRMDRFEVVIGFDMDGYRVAGPHVAAIKGVIADELRFERGPTRWTMALQARCERANVEHASSVITTSAYAARRIFELYGRHASVVPECINLDRWLSMLRDAGSRPDPAQFTVLCVCRFYPRKRVDVLLRAAALLPGVRFRIVGGGPEEAGLKRLSGKLGLGSRVTFLGTVSRATLAREYSACDVFCLPSVQEGFGIVFLEAMAAGRPIVGARAAAVPEVVTDGLLAEPDDAASLAAALERLRVSPDLRAALAEGGLRTVAQYDAPRVARLFLNAIGAGGRAIAAAAQSSR